MRRMTYSRIRSETGEVVNPPATKPLKTYKVALKESDIFVEV
jgi:nitrite reductase/ring-hydroxylating ferredoxin subunit